MNIISKKSRVSENTLNDKSECGSLVNLLTKDDIPDLQSLATMSIRNLTFNLEDAMEKQSYISSTVYKKPDIQSRKCNEEKLSSAHAQFNNFLHPCQCPS